MRFPTNQNKSVSRWLRSSLYLYFFGERGRGNKIPDRRLSSGPLSVAQRPAPSPENVSLPDDEKARNAWTEDCSKREVSDISDANLSPSNSANAMLHFNSFAVLLILLLIRGVY